MSKFKLEENPKNLYDFIKVIDEDILNLTLINDKYEKYVLYDDNKLIKSFLCYEVTSYYCNIIFWTSSFEEYIKNEVKELILRIKKENNLIISIIILSSMEPYIILFESIGFNKTLNLREHLLINEKYIDVLYLTF